MAQTCTSVFFSNGGGAASKSSLFPQPPRHGKASNAGQSASRPRLRGAIRTSLTKLQADVALVDTDKPWVVDSAKMAASAGNTPFDGQPVQGRVTGLWKGGDVAVIDGLFVNGSARLVAWFATVIRRIQTGYIYNYAFAMIFGIVLLLTMIFLIER